MATDLDSAFWNIACEYFSESWTHDWREYESTRVALLITSLAQATFKIHTKSRPTQCARTNVLKQRGGWAAGNFVAYSPHERRLIQLPLNSADPALMNSLHFCHVFVWPFWIPFDASKASIYQIVIDFSVCVRVRASARLYCALFSFSNCEFEMANAWQLIIRMCTKVSNTEMQSTECNKYHSNIINEGNWTNAMRIWIQPWCQTKSST